jgi:hypothetical protein
MKVRTIEGVAPCAAVVSMLVFHGQRVERIRTSFTDYAHKQLSLDATLGLSIRVTEMWGFLSAKDGRTSF